MTTWETIVVVAKNGLVFSRTSPTAREFTIVSYAETPENAGRCADVIATAVLTHGGIHGG